MDSTEAAEPMEVDLPEEAENEKEKVPSPAPAKESDDECIIPELGMEGRDVTIAPVVEPADPGADLDQVEPEIHPEIPPDTYYIQIQTSEKVVNTCSVCSKTEAGLKYNCTYNGDISYICGDSCLDRFKESNEGNVKVHEYFSKFYTPIQVNQNFVFTRHCKQCASKLLNQPDICMWEGMEFCKEHCLYRYQKRFKECVECKQPIVFSQLGKYAVRFGAAIRQFCSNDCVEAKKKRIRICAYCQKSISKAKVVVGSKYFCHDICKGMYECLQNPKKPPFLVNPDDARCYVCKSARKMQIELDYHRFNFYFCGYACYTIFRFVQNCAVHPKKCHTCAKYMLPQYLAANSLFYDEKFKLFCSSTCQTIYIMAHRKVISCTWCSVKKYNYDMVFKYDLYDQPVYACSLLCLDSLKVTIDTLKSKKKKCHQCGTDNSEYDVKVHTGETFTFCSNDCINLYQSQFNKGLPVPVATPIGTQHNTRRRAVIPEKPGPLPVITNVCSLAPGQKTEPTIRKLIVIKGEPLPEVRNVSTATIYDRIDQETSTSIEYTFDTKEMQTEEVNRQIIIKPILVPIYMPAPFPMWSVPIPRPVAFPFFVPCPVLIPLTKNTAANIMKEVTATVVVKQPDDPYEADLLMMADLVAAEAKEEAEKNAAQDQPSTSDSIKSASASTSMNLKVEPGLTVSSATIKPSTSNLDLLVPMDTASTSSMGNVALKDNGEKPDANMCLKYTFGVNAWKQWVTTKNQELQRSSRRLKLFKTDLLQMTADEFNYSLCLFVKEVRKPNGSEYAPDTIYYLCLGIQLYLYENGRIDNIFCDPYYEKFTDCLDEVCLKFSALYNDSHYIVTRVEEEHLWESKQLGAHSPHVLLSTLMFFNTKYFNLTTVDEHMQLSFSHIMKHWKRNPGQQNASKAGSRNVLLRFYPPVAALEGNSKKKKLYEQQENEENPLRCPVKLYEFYLSKCPESVKTRNDVFYLLPERSCVPDSPVWYSTQALDKPSLYKMLHRVKMVKEINVALLTQ